MDDHERNVGSFVWDCVASNDNHGLCPSHFVYPFRRQNRVYRLDDCGPAFLLSQILSLNLYILWNGHRPCHCAPVPVHEVACSAGHDHCLPKLFY